MEKDKAILRRNKMFWHFARDDSMFTTIRVISKHQDTQVWSALLPRNLTNQAMFDSEAYKTYHAYATAAAKVLKSGKKKLPTQGLETLLEITLFEAKQIKIATKRSKIQFYSSHASGSGADKGTDASPWVPDVPTYHSNNEGIFWKSSDDEDDNDGDNQVMMMKMMMVIIKEMMTKMIIMNKLNQMMMVMTLVIPSFPLMMKNRQRKIALILLFKHLPMLNTMMMKIMTKLRDEAQAKNEEFINKLDENIKKIIKEKIKVQVKEKVSKILPKIKKFVNDQLESKVLTRSLSESKTSHAVAASLSELELKKILIDKMESNKLIHRSDQQKTLYKELIEAYETDKVIHDIYMETLSRSNAVKRMRMMMKNPLLD
nr:hypothetical protein [Tanacetum cinerariifolium]